MAVHTVIAEIGGSSSRWALMGPVGEAHVHPVKGTSILGFNPLSGDPDRFVDDVRRHFMQYAPDAFQAGIVHVYAAGTGHPDRQERMRATLARLWPTAVLSVNTDLLGAARGLCGDDTGLVLILGTGMNAGYYDGQVLYNPMPSLGWALGDEGSGADIGRVLLQDAFAQRMPGHVREALFGPEGPQLDAVLEQVYRSPFPARNIAAPVARLADLVEEAYVRNLLMARFHAMAELLVTFFQPDKREAVYATGSVAHGFKHLLGECLLDRGMTLMAVEPDPLPGLVRLHQRPA